MKKEKVLRLQTLGEEIGNAVSHGAGALLGVFGTMILIFRGMAMNSLAAVLSGILYGGSLTILYTVSCLYHSLKRNRAKKVFRILDHCSIFLLISGTYAPISVLLIGGKTGWMLITVNTLCAVIGIVLNAINMEKWEKLSLLLYVIMGWMCLFTVKPLIQSTPNGVLWLLVSGGIAYTFGIIFYKADDKKYMHFVWHLFVLVGSVLHFFYVLKSCYI
ncbi:MAG: hemolysin III family protein [Clostridia bacterium]|nr:hemolysin III family protein [Clostridia bacterium]